MPVCPDFDFIKSDGPSTDEETAIVTLECVDIDYCSAVGSLTHLMMGTGFDKSFAMTQLATFCNNPRCEAF